MQLREYIFLIIIIKLLIILYINYLINYSLATSQAYACKCNTPIV